MRTHARLVAFASAACFGFAFDAPAAKGGTKPQNFLARSDFLDATGKAIQSDGQFSFVCPGDGASYDYIDNTESCSTADVKTASYLLTDATYFLRAFPGDLTGQPRWLVLDFGTDVTNPACPDLDTQLSSYPGRDPGVTDPPVNGDPCVDNVAVRFFADRAFKAGAQTSVVYLLIDGPDAVTTGRTSRLQWNAKYRLEFVNPLSVSSLGADTIKVGNSSDDFRAELWTLNKSGVKNTLLGIVNMPLEVIVKKTSQVL